MANLKKFLIPMAVALTGVNTARSQATVEPHPAPTALPSDQTVAPAALSRGGAQRVIFAEGEELHALLLTNTQQGVIMADHESHYSHRSHSSHRSHYSGQ